MRRSTIRFQGILQRVRFRARPSFHTDLTSPIVTTPMNEAREALLTAAGAADAHLGTTLRYAAQQGWMGKTARRQYRHRRRAQSGPLNGTIAHVVEGNGTSMPTKSNDAGV